MRFILPFIMWFMVVFIKRKESDTMEKDKYWGIGEKKEVKEKERE